MLLVDKARGIRKQAMLGGLLASHVGQNLIGRPMAKSKWFKKDVAKSALMGAAGKQSPRSAGTYAKDASMGLIAPEVNAAKNQAYMSGKSMAKELHNKVRKTPEYKAARKAQKASGGDLKLPMSTKRKLVTERKKVMEAGGLSKADVKAVQKLPKGYRAPSSTKAAVAANAALALVPGGQSTAAVNAAKLVGGTKKFSDSAIGKKISNKMVNDPMKKNFDTGVAKGHFSKWKNNAMSIGVNPFSAEAERQAYVVGKKHSSSIKKAKKILAKSQ